MFYKEVLKTKTISFGDTLSYLHFPESVSDHFSSGNRFKYADEG